MYRPLK